MLHRVFYHINNLSGFHFQVVRRKANGLDDKLANEGIAGNCRLQSLAWKELGEGPLNRECKDINTKGNEGWDHHNSTTGQ